MKEGEDKGCYYNEYFLRGRPDLAASIQRQKLKREGSKLPLSEAPPEPNLRLYQSCADLSPAEIDKRRRQRGVDSNCSKAASLSSIATVQTDQSSTPNFPFDNRHRTGHDSGETLPAGRSIDLPAKEDVTQATFLTRESSFPERLWLRTEVSLPAGIGRVGGVRQVDTRLWHGEGIGRGTRTQALPLPTALDIASNRLASWRPPGQIDTPSWYNKPTLQQLLEQRSQLVRDSEDANYQQHQQVHGPMQEKLLQWYQQQQLSHSPLSSRPESTSISFSIEPFRSFEFDQEVSAKGKWDDATEKYHIQHK